MWLWFIGTVTILMITLIALTIRKSIQNAEWYDLLWNGYKNKCVDIDIQMPSTFDPLRVKGVMP